MTKTGAPTNETEITERREAALSDWDAIVRAFYVLFDGLGKIEQHETCIAFESIAPDLATRRTAGGFYAIAWDAGESHNAALGLVDDVGRARGRRPQLYLSYSRGVVQAPFQHVTLEKARMEFDQ